MKKCALCKVLLSVDSFPKNKTTKDGLSYYCKECAVKKTMESRSREKIKDPSTGKTVYSRKHVEYAVNSKEYHRNLILKKKYGITLSEYNNLVLEQDHKCAICKIPVSNLPKTLDVDHCHITGKIRGLLCGKCNMGIGYFKDDTTLLEAAIKYLQAI